MNSNNQARTVLSIAPCTAGFGFAFVREPANLLDWGNKWIAGGGKNDKALAAVEKMIARVSPSIITLPDALETGSRRAKRIQKLVRDIALAAQKHGVAVKLVTQRDLRAHFFTGESGTKYGRAKILAQRFPQELAHLLPSKRQPWMSENPKMAMFDAIAFGCTHF